MTNLVPSDMRHNSSSVAHPSIDFGDGSLQPDSSQCRSYAVPELLLAAVFFAATLLMETGWLQWSFHQLQGWMKKTTSRVLKRSRTRQGYKQTQVEADGDGAEDEDVREEREALQSGQQQSICLLYTVMCCMLSSVHYEVLHAIFCTP